MFYYLENWEENLHSNIFERNQLSIRLHPIYVENYHDIYQAEIYLYQKREKLQGLHRKETLLYFSENK